MDNDSNSWGGTRELDDGNGVPAKPVSCHLIGK